MTLNNPKQLAKKIVQNLAPDELPLFDEMWMDFEENGSIDEADVSDRRHGMGSAIEISYITTIIIPLVVAFSSRLLVNSADALFTYIKDKILGGNNKKRTSLSDEEIKELAVRVSKQLANKD